MNQNTDDKEEETMSITLWGQASCGPCKPVKRKLDTSGVDYQYRDITDPENEAQVESLRDQGFTGTPIVETPTETFQGHHPSKLDAAIAQAQSAQRQQARVSAGVHQDTQSPGAAAN